MNDFWAQPHTKFHADTYFAQWEERNLWELAEGCNLANCLDIGCGDPRRGQRILSGYRSLDSVDRNADKQICCGARLGDLLSWGSDSGDKYTVVLCSRVLCNIPESRRLEAVKCLADLVEPSGHLLLADGVAKIRERAQMERVRSGAAPLPPSSSGSRELEPAVLHELAKYFVCEKYTIPAADYMLYTRVYARPLLSIDDPKRYTYPRYSQEQRERFCWARCWKLRRCA